MFNNQFDICRTGIRCGFGALVALTTADLFQGTLINQEDTMKRLLTMMALSLSLALAPAALAKQGGSSKAKPAKTMSAHAEAVKKCNDDYKAAAKKANDDYAAALKDAKGKKGKERAAAMKAASTAKREALAAASKAKKECIAAAPKK
jgi:hypothetical protein